MNNTEQHYLHLIEMERVKLRPGIDRNELAEIEFELKRLKGLLLQHRRPFHKSKLMIERNT